MEEIQQAIVKSAIDVSKDIVKDILKFAATSGKRELMKFSVKFEGGFKKFLDRNYRDISKLKTLLNPSSPVALESTFESPTLKIDDGTLNEDEFLEWLEITKYAVITGIGGSGKSIFLKHIFIRYYKEARGKVPFFIELRKIQKGGMLLDYMSNKLTDLAKDFDVESLKYGLQSGKFVILLDGLDEVDPDFRAVMVNQIADLVYKYEDNIFLLTSRPDLSFGAWNEFSIVELMGFSKEQAISLIGKLKYDKEIKSSFAGEVEVSLYDTHSEYLSNPLLCIIMLMTFHQGAAVPKKMNVFFSQAFDVLFYKHDSTKGASYRRKFNTKISIDDFKRVFEAFSTFAYTEYGVSLKHSEANECAEKAIAFNRIDEKTTDFMDDLCTSISIIIKDADQYNYIHRSFQEYFVARFLARQDFSNWSDLIENILIERPNDNVIDLLWDINKDRFEQAFLRPRLKDLLDDINKFDIESNPIGVFQLFYLGFGLMKGVFSYWVVGVTGVRPKWTYMQRLIYGNSEVYGRFHDEGDWLFPGLYSDKMAECGFDSLENRANTYFAISNDVIIGGPIHQHLKNIVVLVRERYKFVCEKGEQQSALLSGMFSKGLITQ